MDVIDRAMTCLLAEDSPIAAKVIETLLIRLGCSIVVILDGSGDISDAHGDTGNHFREISCIYNCSR